MDSTIYISGTDLMRSMEQILERFSYIRNDARVRELLGREVADRIIEWKDMIREQAEAPVTIAVVGDFKRGKSTLINALLREEIVTTDVTTETVTVNRLSYGIRANEAILKGNRRVRFSDAELKRESLEELQERLGERFSEIHMTRPNEMLRRICVIDTPGTDDAMRDFSGEVRCALARADIVIYVFNVLYPLSLSEQLFLRAAVKPLKNTKLLLVANNCDRLPDADALDRMKQLVNERVRGLLPDTEVFYISALDELCRVLHEERDEGAITEHIESEFERLRSVFDAVLEEKQQTVLPDRLQRLVYTMTKEMGQRLQSLRYGVSVSEEQAARCVEEMDADRQRLIEEQKQLQAQLSETVDCMQTQAVGWTTSFLDRLNAEMERIGTMPEETVRRYFESYCIDKLQEALNACLEVHQTYLFDRLDAYAEGLSQRLADSTVRQRIAPFRMNLDVRVWTKGDTAGTVINYLGSFGFFSNVATLVASAVAGGVRAKEKEKQQSDMPDAIRGSMARLYTMMQEVLSERYGDVQDALELITADYFTDRMKELENDAALISEAAGHTEEERANTLAVLDEMEKLLGELQSICVIDDLGA